MFADRAPIERLVASRRLERVPTNMAHALSLIEQAHAHHRGAEAVFELDPAGAYTLAYEAARKSLTAVLLAQGLRPTTVGGHRVLVEVFREAPSHELSELAGSFERMRRRRHEIAYPREHAHDLPVSDVRDALPIVDLIVLACTAALDPDRGWDG